jgi:hypothetical protein
VGTVWETLGGKYDIYSMNPFMNGCVKGAFTFCTTLLESQQPPHVDSFAAEARTIYEAGPDWATVLEDMGSFLCQVLREDYKSLRHSYITQANQARYTKAISNLLTPGAMVQEDAIEILSHRFGLTTLHTRDVMELCKNAATKKDADQGVIVVVRQEHAYVFVDTTKHPQDRIQQSAKLVGATMVKRWVLLVQILVYLTYFMCI